MATHPSVLLLRSLYSERPAHQAGSPSFNGSAASRALESDIVPPDRTLLDVRAALSHSRGNRARLAPQAPE
jgi:hypothetical protein